MKRTTVLLLSAFLCVTSPFVYSQNYTWKKGSNVIEQPGTYGTPGVAAPLNTPGGRQGSTGWKDASGKLWLFGGFGKDASGNYNVLNDLWKYDPVTNQWTFMKGDVSGIPTASYGVMGTASSTNKPGGRYFSVGWSDASGNLWLFGGQAFDNTAQQGTINDLWKYNIATNEWTWIKGSSSINQAGTYGTQGTGAPGNIPGARQEAISWKDASGNFWLFGGYGVSSNTGMLNDLWKYNVSLNEWTWVRGSNSYDVNGTYGTQGTAAPGNDPGSRRSPTGWTDASGNFWLLGGLGYTASGPLTGHLNDLWKFNPASGQWTWINGSNTYDQLGVYGSQGTPNPANHPGSRMAGLSYSDNSGNLWVLGGAGFGVSVPSVDFLNDLWRYNIATNTWTWMKGGNSISQAGVYGTQGVPSPLNTPGGRWAGLAWFDSGNTYFFGGHGYDTNSQTSYGNLNDLWKFGNCVQQTVTINTGSSSICAGSSATLTANGAFTYSWQSGQTTPVIVVAPSASTFYHVYSTDNTGCGDSASVMLSVNALPTITATSSDLQPCPGTPVTISASGAVSYAWSTGAFTPSFTAVASNTLYSVTGTDANGCKNTATVSQSVTSCNSLGEVVMKRIMLYPNPSSGHITVNGEVPGHLYIESVSGQPVFEKEISGSHDITLELAPGVYIYKFRNEKGTSSGKLLISN